ncbi:MAG: MBL fold metallo-hydrolase [Eubacteriales bacterium]|jgi:beta-lactamase superfamily II metal-dependent hydrolase
MAEKKKYTAQYIALAILVAVAILIAYRGAGPLALRLRLSGWIPPFHGEWRVVQYAGTSENQSMFYSIEDSSGGLVLIDGGWNQEGDIEQVWSAIKKHRGHVDAWVITHAHPDHAGAFLGVMKKYGDQFTVDQIYTPPVNMERFEETAQDYDVPEVFEEFYSLTSEMDNVTYLEENDEVDLLGLDMKVLHSWDSHVDEQDANLLNDGSLMFRVSGAEDTILFCADTQKEMEQYILENHADELKADYVQCGHHGNWGLTTDFYDRVDASVAMIDAPSSITEDTTGTYDCPQLIQYFEQKGTGVSDWQTQQYAFLIR